jgi:hypothetical protein
MQSARRASAFRAGCNANHPPRVAIQTSFDRLFSSPEQTSNLKSVVADRVVAVFKRGPMVEVNRIAGRGPARHGTLDANGVFT